jgi:uncharacterized protein YjiS (DUF1127 family)
MRRMESPEWELDPMIEAALEDMGITKADIALLVAVLDIEDAIEAEGPWSE